MKRFNERLAWRLTNGTGTMWTAYAFAALSFVSLPAALHTHQPLIIVSWLAQTFLQLVLLPVIMVGQRLQGAETEKRDQETHDAVMAELGDLKIMHRELHRVMRSKK